MQSAISLIKLSVKYECDSNPKIEILTFNKPIKYLIDPFHIVISLSNRSLIEKSMKPFLKTKGQIAY